jgi:hypothetical protein
MISRSFCLASPALTLLLALAQGCSSTSGGSGGTSGTSSTGGSAGSGGAAGSGGSTGAGGSAGTGGGGNCRLVTGKGQFANCNYESSNEPVWACTLGPGSAPGSCPAEGLAGCCVTTERVKGYSAIAAKCEYSASSAAAAKSVCKSFAGATETWSTTAP